MLKFLNNYEAKREFRCIEDGPMDNVTAWSVQVVFPTVWVVQGTPVFIANAGDLDL